LWKPEGRWNVRGAAKNIKNEEGAETFVLSEPVVGREIYKLHQRKCLLVFRTEG